MKNLPIRLAVPVLLALAGTLTPGLAQERSKPVSGTLPLEASQALNWRSVGPANMGGRITDIAAHPTDSSAYWIATAGGGLLKTVNNGVTYEHQFTNENVASIGAVAVSASNPDIVWVGTGENNPRNSVSWGDGVYKSTDGGATWKHMGLEESFQISTVVIHPENPDVVYVGALGHLWGPNEERGLFKTTDGGETWEKILYVDDLTGVIEVKMSPGDPDTLLIATYERERDMFDTNDPAKKWGPGCAMYKTTDGGANFTKVTAGLPTGILGRIGINYYAADPNVVYAVVESEKIAQVPENAAYFGVRAEDADVGARITEVTEESPAAVAGLEKGDVLLRLGGVTIHSNAQLQEEMYKYVAEEEVEVEVSRDLESVVVKILFTKRPEPEEEEGQRSRFRGFGRGGGFSSGLGGQRENIQERQGEDGFEYGGVYRSEDGGDSWKRINSVNPRPMYYSEIRVDPSDDNFIYVLGTSLYRSTDGGETFTADGHDRSVHVDHHSMWIDPKDGRHIILGNDGGIYVTWDRMKTWDHHNHIAIGQFYNVACDSTRDYKVYGGLQDNGSWGGPNRVGNGSGAVNTDWFNVGGGDGFVVRIDKHDPDIIFSESQGGSTGWRNLRTGEGGSVRASGSREVRYRFNWNTPYVLSNHNSKIVYSAGNYVFQSLDRGKGMRRISPEITATDRGAAVALTESPRDARVLYVGTDDGALWMTKTGGEEWIDLFELNANMEGIAKAEPASFTPEQEQPEPQEPVADSQDDVSGTWKCKASGEGIENDDQGNFLIELQLGQGGKVTGHMSSDIGEGDISEGHFDADSGSLRFIFATESMTLAFEGKIDGDRITGEISAAGGAFSFEFDGQRTAEADAEADAGTDEQVEEIEEVAEPDQDPEGTEDEEKPEKKKKKRKFIKDTIDQLLPARFHVSSLTASRFKDSRVYATFDGHRSDDMTPYVYVSEDNGESWESLRANLPDSAGSVRDLEEDLENEDLLFLGTEFGAFVSIDRGESWTELGSGLPTVAVHDFAMHPTSGELIAGTHGRSIWILDITPLREMSEDSLDEDAHLYAPNTVVRWRRLSRAGASGTRRFVGENPSTGAQIFYSLGKRGRDIKLEVHNAAGEVVRELEASGDRGLHRVEWDLRSGRETENSRGQRRFRRGRTASPGTYTVVLTVGGETLTQTLEVVNDPSMDDTRWIAREEELEEERALREESGSEGGEDDG